MTKDTQKFSFEGIIFDYPGKDTWSHLVAENVELLHKAAKELGLKQWWFQDKPNRPHYDIRGGKIQLAKIKGIKQVSERELVRFMQKHYPTPKSNDLEED